MWCLDTNGGKDPQVNNQVIGWLLMGGGTGVQTLGRSIRDLFDP